MTKFTRAGCVTFALAATKRFPWREVPLYWTAQVAGGILGTLVGGRVLARIPEIYFRRTVSLLILALGMVMLSGITR